LEIEKEIGISLPPVGPIPAQVPLSLPRARPRPSSAHLPHAPVPRHCQPSPTRQPLLPFPASALSLSLSTRPRLSAPSSALVIRLSTRSPPATARPVALPLLPPLARFGALRPYPLAPAPSHPITTACRAVPSPLCAIIAATTSIAGARHLSSPSPIAYKRTARASPTPHTGLGLPKSLPRAQSSHAAAPFLRSGELLSPLSGGLWSNCSSS
jgi:hypothetical protein